MKSYQDDDNSNWFNRFLHGDNNWSKKFSDFFDFKKFTGFLNSGGSGGSNNDDDDDNNNDDDDDNNNDDDDDNNNDDDDDNNNDDVDQSPIDSANISFDIGIKKLNLNGKISLQNVVDKCIFHSAKSFEPLCIRCKFLDNDGKVIATGKLIDPKSSYIASSPQTIKMYPVTAIPASNDVQNFETVKLEICGFKKPGFFVGGGKVYVPKNGNIKSFTLTHGFELHCDKTMAPNNLEINWLKNKFHLEQLVTAKCYDDGSVNEPPPSPHPGPTLDVYYGKGYGRYNGQCGALAEWVMDDNGEPGKADQIVALRITYGTGVFEINPGELGVTDTSRSGTWKNPGGINDNSLWLDLKTGNHQFVPHPASHPNPPTQTTPCPRVPTP